MAVDRLAVACFAGADDVYRAVLLAAGVVAAVWSALDVDSAPFKGVAKLADNDDVGDICDSSVDLTFDLVDRSAARQDEYRCEQREGRATELAPSTFVHVEHSGESIREPPRLSLGVGRRAQLL